MRDTIGRYSATFAAAPRGSPLGCRPWLGDVNPHPRDAFAAELVHADAEHLRPVVVAHGELADPDVARAGDASDACRTSAG